MQLAIALVVCGLVLAFVEVGFGVVSGWDHALGYFAVCSLLVVAYSATLALVFGGWQPLRGWAIPLWIAGVAGVLEKGRDGVIFLLVYAALRWLLRMRDLGLLREAIVASGAIGAGLMRALSFVGPRREPARGALLLVAPVVSSPLWSPERMAGRPSQDPPAVAAGPAGPSIVIIVLDTVGVRHLGLYGHERPTTPRLEAFLATRERAAVYRQAFSNGSWTFPSHASLVTGLLPSDHGAHHGGADDEEGEYGFALSAEATLAEVLRAAGYHTIALFANRLELMGGFHRGFDVFYRPAFPERLPLMGEELRKMLVPGLYAEARKPYPDGSRVGAAVERQVGSCARRPC